MSKRSVVVAIGLITVGIVMGVLLVSNFSGGVNPGWASDDEPKLGGPRPIKSANQDLVRINASFIEVAKAVTPTVVSITVTSTRSGDEMPRDFFHFFGPDFRQEPQPSQGSGSGVILTSDGYIATNNHVVEGSDKGGIEVTLYDKSKYKATLIGTDETTDLAVIKITAKNLPVAALGNSDKVEVGEWVLAIGNPLGLTSTVTAGIVSATGRGQIGVISRAEQPYGIENFIQTDAAINPGNSGGALVNIYGEVVGINTAIATTNARYQGYGFAVPVNLLKVVARDLIKDGKVRRGYIGVSIQEVDQKLAKALGLEKAQGVIVQQLVKGGAGEAAGLKEGDIILSIDGKEVNVPNELQSYVASKHPGDVVTLKIFRERKTIDKAVTLKPRVDEVETVSASDRERKEKSDAETASDVATFDKLGMSVRTMTSEELTAAKLSHGVVVTDVKPYGEAFQGQIRRGNIIVEADNRPIKSADDFKRIVDGADPGESILLRLRTGDGASVFTAIEKPAS